MGVAHRCPRPDFITDENKTTASYALQINWTTITLVRGVTTSLAARPSQHWLHANYCGSCLSRAYPTRTRFISTNARKYPDVTNNVISSFWKLPSIPLLDSHAFALRRVPHSRTGILTDARTERATRSAPSKPGRPIESLRQTPWWPAEFSVLFHTWKLTTVGLHRGTSCNLQGLRC
jgi:hypothetical protein